MLDRNTDLTENRLFHDKPNKYTDIADKLYKLLGIHTLYLFRKELSFDADIKICLAKSGLFLNYIDEKLYDYYSKPEKYCDCCGRIMNSWLSVLDSTKYTKRYENMDICQDCNRQLDKNSIFYSNFTLNKIFKNIMGDKLE